MSSRPDRDATATPDRENAQAEHDGTATESTRIQTDTEQDHNQHDKASRNISNAPTQDSPSANESRPRAATHSHRPSPSTILAPPPIRPRPSPAALPLQHLPHNAAQWPGSPGPYPRSQMVGWVPVPGPMNPASETAGHIPEMYEYLDRRIKDPTPSNIKGWDKKGGRFSVMNLSLTSSLDERNAEAQRTSEGTAEAARKANKAGYRSVHPKELAWIPKDESSFLPIPQPPLTLPVHQSQPQHTLTPEMMRRLYGPSSVETKTEQTRILSLLKTFSPVAVVDALCKAVAHYGGDPEEAPETTGGFPSSTKGNGPGSVFISWLAEVFSPAEFDQSIGLPKRRRGRPKGSKSSRARKDKGIKKGPYKKKHKDRVTLPPPPPEDTENSIPTQTVPANSNPSAPNGEGARLLTDASRNNIPAASPSRPRVADSSTGNTPGSKKRGRPKGSKNKPKNKITAGGDMNEISEALSNTITPSVVSTLMRREEDEIVHEGGQSPQRNRGQLSQDTETGAQTQPQAPSHSQTSSESLTHTTVLPQIAEAVGLGPSAASNTSANAQKRPQQRSNQKSSSRKRAAAQTVAEEGDTVLSQPTIAPDAPTTTSEAGSSPKAKRRRTAIKNKKGQNTLAVPAPIVPSPEQSNIPANKPTEKQVLNNNRLAEEHPDPEGRPRILQQNRLSHNTTSLTAETNEPNIKHSSSSGSGANQIVNALHQGQAISRQVSSGESHDTLSALYNTAEQWGLASFDSANQSVDDAQLDDSTQLRSMMRDYYRAIDG